MDWLFSILGGGSGPPFLHGDPVARLPRDVPLPCSPQPREGSVVPELLWEGRVPFSPQDEQGLAALLPAKARTCCLGTAGPELGCDSLMQGALSSVVALVTSPC